MGGIPYQSPGCTSCRKRKVRCDLGKPQCMRCIKRKVPCPGYEKDRIFLHQVAPPTSSDQQIQYIGRARPFILSPAVSAGPALRSQMVSTFLDASFPINLGFSDKIDVLPSLVVNISTRSVKSEMLERALSAVSCIYLGRINKDENLVHTGVGHYDMAIRYMSFMLYRRFQTDDMIYTTVIFQLLQSLYCPYGLRVWLAHMAGTNALLGHCSQHASSAPLIENIYRKLQKLMMIYSTIVMKWPEAEYKNLQQQKETGTPLDDLFELFATEASLLSTTEQINHSDRHACELLLQDCLSHRERIMRWYSQNELYIGGPPIFCEPGETPCPRLPPAEDLFGVPYQFNTPDHARLHVLYWTALTMVQSLIYQARVLVLAHFNPADTFPVNPRAHGDYLLSEHYAGEICRAVPYCLQPKMKLAGARIILPTMPHIYKPYMHLRDEKRFTWCQKVSSLLADLGFHMAEQLHRTASRYWSLSEDPNTNSILSLSLRWEISEDENSAPISTPGKNNEAWGVTQTTEVHGRNTTVENSQNTTEP